MHVSWEMRKAQLRTFHDRHKMRNTHSTRVTDCFLWPHDTQKSAQKFRAAWANPCHTVPPAALPNYSEGPLRSVLSLSIIPENVGIRSSFR